MRIILRCKKNSKPFAPFNRELDHGNSSPLPEMGEGDMRLSLQLFGIAACFVVAGAPPVSGAPANDQNTCANASGDVAIAACTRAINSGRLRGHDLAVAYYNRGIEYRAKGDSDRAIADYNQAISLDPKYATAYNNRGNAYQNKGEDDRAIADYSEAIKLNPKSATYYLTRGGVYDDKGDYDRAIADATEAIRLDPKSVSAYNNRGHAYRSKEDYENAIADFNQAIVLDPKDGILYYNRGKAYYAKGDHKHAFADYDQAIKLSPKFIKTYYFRGMAHLYAGSLPKALADFNQASELDLKNANSALWLDMVGRRSGLPSRLPQAISLIDMTQWPAPIIRLFLGQFTPEAALAAGDSPNVVTKRAQVCEATFHSGELALLQGAKDDALHLFHLAAEGCPKNFPEWYAATDELKALGAAQ
jgi:tetratricopeptide (TPR) repeat protein